MVALYPWLKLFRLEAKKEDSSNKGLKGGLFFLALKFLGDTTLVNGGGFVTIIDKAE